MSCGNTFSLRPLYLAQPIAPHAAATMTFSSLLLAKQALNKDPNYVDFDYRKEQLWGEKLQISTENLFKNQKLQKDIKIAKSKINKSS